MGSRLIIALSGLLVVATANATSILGIDDATSLSNFGTGMKLVTPQIGSGYTYFPGTTTVAATNEDAAWDYTYYASSNVGPQQALVTTTSIIPNTWVDYNSGDWIGFCDCATSTTYTGNQVIYFDTKFFVANSNPLTLPNAYIDVDFAADTRAAGSTAQVVINGNIVATISGTNGYLGPLNVVDITNGPSGCNGCISGISASDPTGQNTFEIRLNMPNGPYATDPDGILVQFIGSDDGNGNGPPPPPGTPEPGSAFLVVTGIAVLVAGVRRSKRS